MEELLKKHRISHARQQRSGPEKEERQADVKSSGILRMEAHIEQAKNNQKVNNYILWLFVALIGLFFGIFFKS